MSKRGLLWNSELMGNVPFKFSTSRSITEACLLGDLSQGLEEEVGYKSKIHASASAFDM